MSIKSVLVYSTLLVLDFYIECLMLVAHCLVFMLDCLKDDPAVNQAAVVPIAETTCVVKDGTTNGTGPKVVGTTLITKTNDSVSTHPLPSSALAQTDPPPTPPSLPIVQTSQGKAVAVPLTNESDFPSTPSTPALWTHPEERPLCGPERMDFETDRDSARSHQLGNEPNMRPLGPVSGAEVPRSTFSSGSEIVDYELRLIIPCWDYEDVIGDGSTCPVTINPSLIASPHVAVKPVLRAQELERKFRSSGNISSAKRASHILDHLLAVTHPSDELLGTLLLLQAVIRSELFTTTDDDSLLDKSIDGYQAALSLLPRNAAQRHDMLYAIGTFLKLRHDRKRRGEDLDQAIEAHGELLASWPPDKSPPLELLRNLGNALRERCEIKGDVSDVEKAIQHLDQLLSLVGDHAERPHFLLDLGIAFLTRCRRTGSLTDAERAIRHLEEALSLQTHDNQNRPLAAHSLALAFSTRYDISGRASDLDDAIRLCQEALLLGKPDPLVLNNLAGALRSRYKRTGDVTDLGQAILHLERAVSLLDHDDPRRPNFLGNLATVLGNLHDTSKFVTDLDKAIDLHEQALSLLSSNHPQRPGTLNNLFTTLHKRFLASGDVADKKRGLDCLKESLSLIPPDHPYRQSIVYNFLSAASTLVPQDAWPMGHLEFILNQCTELVKLTHQQHTEYSKMTTLTAPLLLTCHQRELDIRQFLLAAELDSRYSAEDAALALLEQGSKASASSSISQLEATCEWIQLCQALNRPCTLEMFTRMFDLLDLSIARSCSIETRHRQLSTNDYILPAKKLVAEAVAFAIQQGTVETAVEFLERGQSILLAQLSRYRSSSLLKALHSVRPDLANRFRDLSWQVEHATFTEGHDLLEMVPTRPLENPISRSNRLKSDWEDVVQQIRALDGFHHFLLPTPFSVLRQAAAEGPVILVNISKSQSDAIIITSDQPPIAVSLPFATPDRVDRLVSAFKSTPQSMSNRGALNGLKAIWDTIVEPVVTELQDSLDLPKNSRIWWCPTNSAVSLPLHAAGLYQPQDEHYLVTRNCLPTIYISSYTPTLGALIQARQDESHGYSSLPSVVLVGQPNTPGQTEIPDVRDEIRRIKKRIPHSLVLMDEHATHDAVLTAIVQHQWVHLACHGHVQSQNPLRSHFSFHDGPLPLLKIMQQRLPIAQFAFLSACHSASGNSSTPDEFLHLAAGMQFAGFRSVVGTMWAMADDAGPPLADEFYRKMLPKRGTVDHRMAAQALHGATKKLWKDGTPLAVWINFVHWGA